MVKKLLKVFKKKNCKKLVKKNLKTEKVLKRKGDKLHVKWKGYNNRFQNYLRYKLVSSQNVPSESQIKNFFIL